MYAGERRRLQTNHRSLTAPTPAPATPVKVLLVAPQPFYTERGTPIAVRLMAQVLAELGHEVDLLVYPYGEDIDVPGVRVLRCRRVPFIAGVGIGFSWAKVATDVSLTASLLHRSLRRRYDVIHAVEEAVYPALALRWVHRSKVVYDMDSSIAAQLCARAGLARAMRPLFDFLERAVIRRADRVVAVCEALAVQARSVRPANGVHVIPDVPVPGPAEPGDVDDLQRIAGEGRTVALYVGNLQQYQGIGLLLDAAAALPANTGITIVVVGGDGPELVRYRELVRERGLDSRVVFAGPRPLAQLNPLLRQAVMLLSPRISGGNTPLKIYSYMQAKRPILATRLSTHTQVLDDSTAELVAPEPRAFAAGLIRLAGDRARRRALAGAALTRVERDYSLDMFRRRTRLAYARFHTDTAGASKR